MGKILEKLTIDKVTYHLYSNDLLSNRQFGITRNKPTEDAVCSVVDWIKEVFN
jgi:hypothetical protein